jgi:hypothetical protein
MAVVVVDADVAMTRTLNAEIVRSAQLVPAAVRAAAPVVFKNRAVVKYDATPPPSATYACHECTNGFVQAFRLAYNYHMRLRLSPDGVLLTVLQTVSTYINAHSGRSDIRSAFVTHEEGKKELCVLVPPEWEETNAPDWPWVLGEIKHMVLANVKDAALVAAFTPAFTTTTPDVHTSATICLMAGLQKFFDFGMMTFCGIGEVIMDGTAADWDALRVKVASIGDVEGLHELRPWLAKLDGTLAQLAATAHGTPDAAFWQHAYSEEVRHGSGGGTFLSGWFLDFFNHDHPTIDINKLPAGAAEVPFFWRKLDSSKTLYTLVAGSWTAYVSDADGALTAFASPAQWAVLNTVVKAPPALPPGPVSVVESFPPHSIPTPSNAEALAAAREEQMKKYMRLPLGQ